MSEIDFDELDRAVNSLQTDNAPGAKAVDAPNLDASKSQPSVAPISPKPADMPVATSDSQAIGVTRSAASAVTGAVRPARPMRPVVSARREGVIDIMNPTKKVLRVAAPLQPVRNNTTGRPVDALSVDGAVTSSAASTNSKDDTPATQADSTPGQYRPSKTAASPAQSAWPDPIDYHAAVTASAAAKDESSQPVQEPPQEPSKESSDEAQEENHFDPPEKPFYNGPALPAEPSDVKPDLSSATEPEAASSPFLTDAKVQKRPLGAFAATPAGVSHGDESSAPASSQATAQAVDSASAPESVPLAPAPLDTPESQLHQAAAMSIPQQYRAGQQQLDDSHRPVYDTGEYHPPLLEEHAHHAHRPNKVGAILTLLTIAVLMAVGGYLMFIYVTQAR